MPFFGVKVHLWAVMVGALVLSANAHAALLDLQCVRVIQGMDVPVIDPVVQRYLSPNARLISSEGYDYVVDPRAEGIRLNIQINDLDLATESFLKHLPRASYDLRGEIELLLNKARQLRAGVSVQFYADHLSFTVDVDLTGGEIARVSQNVNSPNESRYQRLQIDFYPETIRLASNSSVGIKVSGRTLVSLGSGHGGALDITSSELRATINSADKQEFYLDSNPKKALPHMRFMLEIARQMAWSLGPSIKSVTLHTRNGDIMAARDKSF